MFFDPVASDPNASRAILVLADASANWVVAGLRQLDRLALAANEFAFASSERVELCVFWTDDRAEKDRWFPHDARLKNCIATELTQMDGRAFDAIITTRVFVGRGAFGDLLAGLRQTESALTIEGEGIDLFVAQFGTRVRAMQTSKWWYIDGVSELKSSTRNFLATSGRPEDGIVSQMFNRQVSRAISRWVLPLNVRPTTLTFAAFAFPAAGFFCLSDGSRSAQIAGAILFQIHSIISGCDGELARAKYQESEVGRRMDHWSNTLSTALMVFGIGLGGFRSDYGQSITLAEGLFAVVLVVGNELLGARRFPTGPRAGTTHPGRRSMLIGLDAQMFQSSVIAAMVACTRRDVAYVVFLLLVFLGKAEWFLHAIAIFLLVRLIFALRARRTII